MKELIRWLEESFPNRLPYKEINSFELGILVGQQQLIEKLKLKLELEEKIEDVIIK